VNPITRIRRNGQQCHDWSDAIAAVQQLFAVCAPGDTLAHETIARTAGLDVDSHQYRHVTQRARRAYYAESTYWMQSMHGIGLRKPESGEVQDMLHTRHTHNSIRQLARVVARCHIAPERFQSREGLASHQYKIETTRRIIELNQIEFGKVRLEYKKSMVAPQLPLPT
jgi:hypothetical protein